jgi:hypothetical protein
MAPSAAAFSQRKADRVAFADEMRIMTLLSLSSSFWPVVAVELA